MRLRAPKPAIRPQASGVRLGIRVWGLGARVWASRRPEVGRVPPTRGTRARGFGEGLGFGGRGFRAWGLGFGNNGFWFRGGVPALRGPRFGPAFQ